MGLAVSSLWLLFAHRGFKWQCFDVKCSFLCVFFCFVFFFSHDTAEQLNPKEWRWVCECVCVLRYCSDITPFFLLCHNCPVFLALMLWRTRCLLRLRVSAAIMRLGCINSAARNMTSLDILISGDTGSQPDAANCWQTYELQAVQSLFNQKLCGLKMMQHLWSRLSAPRTALSILRCWNCVSDYSHHPNLRVHVKESKTKVYKMIIRFQTTVIIQGLRVSHYYIIYYILYWMVNFNCGPGRISGWQKEVLKSGRQTQ